MRDAIWREYQNGQEVSKTPSIRYLVVQQRAVAEIAFKPFDAEAARICAVYLINSEKWRKIAIERGLGDPLEGLDSEPMDRTLRKFREHL